MQFPSKKGLRPDHSVGHVHSRAKETGTGRKAGSPFWRLATTTTTAGYGCYQSNYSTRKWEELTPSRENHKCTQVYRYHYSYVTGTLDDSLCVKIIGIIRSNWIPEIIRIFATELSKSSYLGILEFRNSAFLISPFLWEKCYMMQIQINILSQSACMAYVCIVVGYLFMVTKDFSKRYIPDCFTWLIMLHNKSKDTMIKFNIWKKAHVIEYFFSIYSDGTYISKFL